MDPLDTAASAGTLISNPATVVVSVGAIFALIAAAQWLKASRSIDTSGQVATGPSKWALKAASLWTAVALFTVAGGFLLGRLLGEF